MMRKNWQRQSWTGITRNKMDKHLHSHKESPEVLEQKFTINNKLGLHARPAALFVQTVSKFESDISIQKGKLKVNGKSIMGVMMLAAAQGSSVLVRISGHDARKAMMAISKLFQNNFNEA